MIRVLNDHYVFASANPGQLRAVYPSLRTTSKGGQTWCALPQTIEAARLLRNLGYNAPSPIRTCYDWPIRPPYKPRWYQIETSEFLTLNPRAFLLSAMRVGKTLSALWASDYLMKQGQMKRALVIAPLSTLECVWAQHIFEHFYERKFVVLHGSRQKRIDLLNSEADYYIINHDGVKILEDRLCERDDINHVIIDEVAVYRNVKNGKNANQKWQSANRVINLSGPKSCWGMTGTPTPNAPTDAYGQAKLILPENVTGSFTKFKNITMQQVSTFKWVPRHGSEEIISRTLKPSIRFTRDVCTDMGPSFIERKAELSAEQKTHYYQLLRECVTEIQGSRVTAVNAAVLVQKLVQAASGVIYGADGSVLRLDFGPRLKVLEELIEENNEKVLVFVPFTGVLNALAEELRKKWSVEIVDGSVSAGKRNRIFKEFQTLKEPHIILAHPGTMAHGLDLTAASLTIWYAPYWKAEIVQQANARTDGSRQQVKIDIAHIYATAEERRIYNTILEKGKLQDVVLALAREGK